MQADEKWALLEMVSEWVRYADAKAAVVLGFQGAVAGFFFAQRSDFSQLAIKYGSVPAVFFACGLVFLIASIFLSAFSVYPRLRNGKASSNIFFAHIGQAASADDFRNRLAKPKQSFEVDVENQIWANSVVAWRKYRLTAISIGTGIVSYMLFGLAAFSAWISVHG